jgi:NAD-dependent SIR2 family protein deacetylase
LNARGKKVTIVTQNIDDFHIKPTKEEYKYYAVHGNVKEVRCDNDHVFGFKDFRKEIM